MLFLKYVNTMMLFPVQPLPGISGSQASRRVTAAVRKVKDSQQRWKGQVNEQRQNIYTKHRILA